MEFYEVIEKRRTIRVFKEAAKEEQLRKVLLAGAKAPSGGNRQPWEFIIVDDQRLIDQLAELKYQNMRSLPQGNRSQKEFEETALKQKNAFQNASIVAICSKSGELPSSWLCIENMSLAAVAEGLGSGIITYSGKYKEEVEKILSLPEGYELITAMRFGKSAEDGLSGDKIQPVLKRPEFSWLHKNKF